MTKSSVKKGKMVKVTDNVYAGVGYALANMTMVITPEGSVIIDTTESIEAAREILKDFREVSDKPVKYVIYTHNHQDHYQGTRAIFEDGATKEDEVTVIAHEDFKKEMDLQESLGLSGRARSAAMFGILLPEEERLPVMICDPDFSVGLRWEDLDLTEIVGPTQTFDDRYSFILGGITFNLMHAPGETPDHIMVHVPQYDVVCSGDNFYRFFPNLYTIRGTSPRPVLDWASAQDRILALKPKYLVPGHGPTLSGNEEITRALTSYKKAILYVHGKAMEAVREFRPIDEVLDGLELPDYMEEPYLRQIYGYIPYCIRAIYTHYVGWFDGNPVNLNPPSRKELGEEIINLTGSVDKVLDHARQALDGGKNRIALELSEMVLLNHPGSEAALQIKAESLLKLADAHNGNRPTANYYRTCASFPRFPDRFV